MKCHDCDGVGEVDDTKGFGGRSRCMTCNGIGTVCDVCGEAVDEHGQNVCEFCEEDEPWHNPNC